MVVVVVVPFSIVAFVRGGHSKVAVPKKGFSVTAVVASVSVAFASGIPDLKNEGSVAVVLEVGLFSNEVIANGFRTVFCAGGVPRKNSDNPQEDIANSPLLFELKGSAPKSSQQHANEKLPWEINFLMFSARPALHAQNKGVSPLSSFSSRKLYPPPFRTSSRIWELAWVAAK